MRPERLPVDAELGAARGPGEQPGAERPFQRLGQVDPTRVARVLAAWSISGKVSIGVMTLLGGLLAGVIGPRATLVAAGLLLLATPLALPRGEPAAHLEPEAAHGGA